MREMIARILKDEINERERMEMRQQKGIPLQEPFRAIIIEIFNKLLNKDKELLHTIKEKMKEKYNIIVGDDVLTACSAGLIAKASNTSPMTTIAKNPQHLF